MANGSLSTSLKAVHEPRVFLDPAARTLSQGNRAVRLRWSACIAAALAVAGVAAIAPTAFALLNLWKNDPLKSIGGVIPAASLVLLLRAWRSIGWRVGFSWWGPILLLATALLVQVRERAVIELVLTHSWSLSLPPPSFAAVAYAAGCALFFGGTRLLWAARFPVCLMALVNPVPHVFVREVDLPLQHISAHLARSFAHAAGANLTPGQLRLMFTPDFGMFIAPGCNGMRGAITMGVLALVAGHVYRLRARWWIALALAGIALGYLFNLLRLCGLVLYYVAALRLPCLQDHAETADYLLGACLFFGAAVLLFSVVNWARADRLPPRAPQGCPAAESSQPSSLFSLRCALFVACAAVAAIPIARRLAHRGGGSSTTENATEFPRALSSGASEFTLRRTWDENLNTGTLLFHWAEYAAAPERPVVAVGVSPTLGAHDTMLCHVARGEDWLWHGDLPLRTADGQTTNFSASFYNDGVTQFVEATTLCTRRACGEYTVGGRRSGLIYSRITPETLLDAETTRPTPVLLRAETTQTLLPPEKARELLTGELQAFVAGIEPARLAALLGRSAR